MQRRVPPGHGMKFSILYLHSPTIRPKYIVRLSEDPLIQDSLTPLGRAPLPRGQPGDPPDVIEDMIGVLSIREIILEIKRFVVHSTDRIREATPELRHVEDVVDSGEMWR